MYSVHFCGFVQCLGFFSPKENNNLGQNFIYYVLKSIVYLSQSVSNK